MPKPFSTSTVMVFQAGAFGLFLLPPLVLFGVPRAVGRRRAASTAWWSGSPTRCRCPVRRPRTPRSGRAAPRRSRPRRGSACSLPRGILVGIPCDSSRLANQSSRWLSSSACSGATSRSRSRLVSTRAITRGNDTRDIAGSDGYDAADGARGNRPVGGRRPRRRRCCGRSRPPWHASSSADLQAIAGERSLFALASLTKPIVALAALVAVEEGALELDAPAWRRMLPAYRDDADAPVDHAPPPAVARLGPARVGARHAAARGRARVPAGDAPRVLERGLPPARACCWRRPPGCRSSATSTRR